MKMFFLLIFCALLLTGCQSFPFWDSSQHHHDSSESYENSSNSSHSRGSAEYPAVDYDPETMEADYPLPHHLNHS